MHFSSSLLPLHMVNYEEEGLELPMTNNGHTGREYWWGWLSKRSAHACQQQAQRPSFLGLR